MDSRTYASSTFAANDQINLALIGSGILGIYDTTSALRVPGVNLVAVCDLYTGRLDRAKELWGDDIFVTRDYREILDRKDVDAVIVATPDHWHKKISIAAMNSGKAVYCEKPMVQNFDEGRDIIKTRKETGKVMQVGSQGMSSLGNEKAKQLYEDGAIGQIVMLDMFNDRYSAEGAWQYPIPPDANPDTVDFDTFLGRAPKVPYELVRFFRWRNYRDYGTGFAMTLYDYPETKTHTSFNAAFRVNLTRSKLGMKPEGYSMIVFTEENQKKIRAAYDQNFPGERSSDLNIGETIYEAPDDNKGSHYDHLYNFFQGKPVKWNPESMNLIQ